jgi:nucleotidyltransferase substrate binding protein (TIGR01987 family)
VTTSYPPQDIRWQQRFANFNKALAQLRKFIAQDSLNEHEAQGLIQCFEYTHELAWKTLKDFLESKGNTSLFGLKDVTRDAFSLGWILEGELWMSMITDRNRTSHTYNNETAQAIVMNIRVHYFRLFESLEKKLASLDAQVLI